MVSIFDCFDIKKFNKLNVFILVLTQNFEGGVYTVSTPVTVYNYKS